MAEWNVGDLVRERASGLIGKVEKITDDGERTWLEVRWLPSTLSTDDMEPYEHAGTDEAVV